MHRQAPQRPTASTRRPTRALALCCVVLGAWLGLGSAAHGRNTAQDEAGKVLGFSIPNTRSAQVRMQRAADHIQAGRWNEAIEDLQELLETHRAELVPVKNMQSADSPVHRGAGGWATEALLTLPVEARALYTRRFEERAGAALQLARHTNDRQAMIHVAERWPATKAAIAAWWTLGDLELEYGNLMASRQAWSRALCTRLAGREGRFRLSFDGENSASWSEMLEQLKVEGTATHPGERERVEFALASLTDENPLFANNIASTALHGNLRLPGPGEGAHGAPGPDASSWPQPFRLPMGGPFERTGWNNLFPVRVGDQVFISDSLQLYAIHAYSGTLEWASELSSDWKDLGNQRDEYFKGISTRDAMIAPAASEHIVVSAHQIPVSDIHNEEFRRIAITTVIPDRRLFAYDTHSGQELWNHRPPPNWDGESGDFVDRMSVAGPPIISASRVIVPLYRMYGRIEFYVACYDLLDGELLWSTQLVSGQRELNMFARSEREFTAPPVRVEGDRVIVLTQLGAVAAVDLFSGSILWETLYDQITPPQRTHFSSQPLKNTWRNAAPVVADGVVIATPFDCRDLLGLDLESGETLWSMRHERIDRIAGQGRSDINLLIGADERTVFLGSWPVLALRSPAGLGREAPTDLAWRYPGGDVLSSESTTARALLLDDRVVIPTRSERIDVDRFGGGRLHKSLPWKGGRNGNLLVDNGTLYSLTPQSLDGYFEWDMLLERGRRGYEEQGKNLPASLYLTSLLVERSRTELEAGHTIQARDWLAEAEEILDPFLSEELTAVELQEQMHDLLRMRGKVFIDLADGSAATTALRRARDYARTISELRDTLIEEYVLVREYDSVARDEILQAFEEHCSLDSLPALVDDEVQHPYGWRFDPVVVSSTRSAAIWRVPISMWVRLERAGIAAREGQVSEEFNELHALLELWPEEPLPVQGLGPEQVLSKFAKDRIGTLLEREGREAYAPFDRAARELLEEARRAHDRDLLESVSELYPFSIAGREANDDLLHWAIEQGDVEAVSMIAFSELPQIFGPEWATDRERQLLLFVAAALEAAGNLTYPGELYRTLAQGTPNLVSAAPTHAGATLRELAAQHPQPAAAKPSPTPRFETDLEVQLAVDGKHRLLGEIPAALAGTREARDQASKVLLYVRESSGRLSRSYFVAYSAESLSGPDPEPLWEARIPSHETPTTWRNTLSFVPGAVIASTPEAVYALRRSDGQRLWTDDWYAIDGDVESIEVGSGLVVATVRTPGNEDALHALDMASGKEVWSARINFVAYDRTPLIGENRVVLMPRRSQRRGLVLDAFSGRPVLEFELPSGIHQTAHAASWIQDGLVVVPWFLTGRNPERNRMVGIDLWTGKLAWDVMFDEVLGGRRQLRSVLQHEGKTYLVLTPGSGAHNEGVRGILAELHVGIGATRRVGNFELDHDQKFVGLPQERRIELSSPAIFLYSFSDVDDRMRVQALELPLGNTRWLGDIGLTRDRIYNSLLRLPVESEDTVALIFSMKKARGFGSAQSTLFLLDKRTGHTLQTMDLEAKLGTSSEITIQGLGRSLVLGGDERMEVLR